MTLDAMNHRPENAGGFKEELSIFDREDGNGAGPG
jgi:hypothetical protein